MKLRSILTICALGAAALLSACATQAPSGSAPLTPEQAQVQALADAQRTIFNLTQAYNGMVSVMLVYKRLPYCGSPGATQLCSKVEVVAQLKQADNIAYESLKAAQDVVRSPGAGANLQTAMAAAQRALEALSRLTATLPK